MQLLQFANFHLFPERRQGIPPESIEAADLFAVVVEPVVEPEEGLIAL